MAATAEYECQCCKKPFTARTADRARGWARFCSKACKAIRETSPEIEAARKQRPWQRFDKCDTLAELEPARATLKGATE